MKTVAQLVLAGIIGGAIAFGAFKMFDKDTIIYESAAPAQKVELSNTAPASSASVALDFTKAAAKANPAVVHISAQNKEYVNYQNRRKSYAYDYSDSFWGYRRRGDRPQAGTGSGVIVSDDGYIVTNNHVVGFADYLEVVTHDGQKYAAEKIGTDPSSDLAVIKIEGYNHPSLDFGDSDDLKVGQWVVAVGNPFNLTSTVTAGIISAMGRDLDIIQGQKTIEEFIQTDAVVNPGNSGGALVDANGTLIGVNTAISSPTGVYAGYSFAIPSNLVKRVYEEIKETGGDIQRANLGITIADVGAAQAQGIKTDVDYGVFVAGVYNNSPAFLSGVEAGDIIIDAGDKKISNVDELQSALKFVKLGDTVDLTVLRNGKKKTIPVKLRQGI